MDTEERSCLACGKKIPPGRLKAIPDAIYCVRCSEIRGGELELEVTITGTGKGGSLKKTGQDVKAKAKHKPLR
jgi:hypothetical protein